MKTNPTELRTEFVSITDWPDKGAIADYWLSKRESELKDLITEIEKMKNTDKILEEKDYVPKDEVETILISIAMGKNKAISDIITKLQERL